VSLTNAWWCGCAELLLTTLTQGCRVLHLSCHGNEQFLALELQNGSAQRVPQDVLSSLLADASPAGVRCRCVTV
jgi:hypothetical protein